jgi:hypothetical protein
MNASGSVKHETDDYGLDLTLFPKTKSPGRTCVHLLPLYPCRSFDMINAELFPNLFTELKPHNKHVRVGAHEKYPRAARGFLTCVFSLSRTEVILVIMHL